MGFGVEQMTGDRVNARQQIINPAGPSGNGLRNSLRTPVFKQNFKLIQGFS